MEYLIFMWHWQQQQKQHNTIGETCYYEVGINAFVKCIVVLVKKQGALWELVAVGHTYSRPGEAPIGLFAKRFLEISFKDITLLSILIIQDLITNLSVPFSFAFARLNALQPAVGKSHTVFSYGPLLDWTTPPLKGLA